MGQREKGMEKTSITAMATHSTVTPVTYECVVKAQIGAIRQADLSPQ
jgi:hypothetical protein